VVASWSNLPEKQKDKGLNHQAKSFVFIGAVEWTRTITSLRPPAPQAGASTNSATTAFQLLQIQQRKFNNIKNVVCQ
jgi:hypothetical protein